LNPLGSTSVSGKSSTPGTSNIPGKPVKTSGGPQALQQAQASHQGAYRVGVDTGGTFTDLVLVDPDGLIVATHKCLSTPGDPARAVLTGLDELLAKAGRPPRQLQPVDVVHGSTVATNALLEHAQARVAFITTAGFEDTLRLARQHRPDLYALVPRRPDPPVLQHRCLGAAERMRHDGTVITALTDAEIGRVVDQLAGLEVEAVAVSLLHSYANDQHERRLGEAIRKRFGDAMHLTLSCELLPEFREYERASTCVINAVVAPRMGRYLRRLIDEIGQDRLRIMASHGGTITPADAIRQPIRMVLSGPAGGVLGAARRDEKRITLDMGGTSTDVALIDQAPTLSTEHQAGGLPIGLPMMDIHTVGAGGGSIAWLDPGGALRVGPQSAAADPGTACYGKQIGPPLATVTDAHAFFGHLPDGHPLGDGLTVQRRLAVAAIEHLADHAGLTAEQTAEGVLRIAEVHMARAVQRISLQRGHDPRGCTLVPFGGAGALHACRLAEQLGMTRVRVPVNPGLLSAIGMLTAPLRYAATQSLHRVIPAGQEVPDFAEVFDLLRVKLPQASQDGMTTTTRHEVALRYAGQSHELMIDLDGAEAMGVTLLEAFHQQHEALFGYHDRASAVELVLVRQWVDAHSQANHRVMPRSKPSAPAAAEASPLATGFLRREELAVGASHRGPFTVTEYSATTLVPEGWTLAVDHDYTLLLTREDADG